MNSDKVSASVIALLLMSLFAIISALLLEKFYPLSNYLNQGSWLTVYVGHFHRYFNTGQRKHGKVAWLMAVLPLLLAAILLAWLLHYLHPFFAWLFNVLVLYLAFNFHPFTEAFSKIHLALKGGDISEARRLLHDWTGVASDELSQEELTRVAIEQALIASHRNVFGIITWFVLFSALSLGGATGALLYRIALFLAERWGAGHVDEQDEYETMSEKAFGEFARRAFYILDWLPIRLTALTFAIVGNFEDTAYCWRNQAATWADKEIGILLSSAAGALGVRLGMPITQYGQVVERPELGIGDEVDVEFIQSATGMVWRSIAFVLILLLLLSLANLLG